MYYRILFLVLVLLCGACSDSGERIPVKKAPERVAIKPEKETKTAEVVPNEWSNQGDTLVWVDAFNKRIYWDLKYASADNFMHRVLYDTLKAVYVQRDVARRLAKCQELLTSIDSSLHLLVYDGVRPLSVQWEMWRALDTIPPAQRGKFVSNPRNGSVHNYGAAVDLTICTSSRKPLDMGAGYDDIRPIAYPSLEAQFIASGELTSDHIKNRQLLRKVMRSQGFINIPTEWWHFNAGLKVVLQQRYKMVLHEPLLN